MADVGKRNALGVTMFRARLWYSDMVSQLGFTRKMHCISLVLFGLIAFAQAPRSLSICFGVDGALRAGFGCQCPA